MAYYELLSPDSYGSYNRRLAKLTSLNTAIYWAEILDIVPKIQRKKTFDSDGYFTLDRAYIEERTTLAPEEQIYCDQILQRINVLEFDPLDNSRLRVNLKTMAEFLIDDKVVALTDVRKFSKGNKVAESLAKKAGMINTMKKLLSETDPEFRSKYEAWVDSVYNSKKGFLTKAKIKMFESKINEYALDDRSLKNELLNIAISTGYTDADWVISKLPIMWKKSTLSQTQRSATELDKNIEF